jgi:hypothetical protein
MLINYDILLTVQLVGILLTPRSIDNVADLIVNLPVLLDIPDTQLDVAFVTAVQLLKYTLIPLSL